MPQKLKYNRINLIALMKRMVAKVMLKTSSKQIKMMRNKQSDS